MQRLQRDQDRQNKPWMTEMEHPAGLERSPVGAPHKNVCYNSMQRPLDSIDMSSVVVDKNEDNIDLPEVVDINLAIQKRVAAFHLNRLESHVSMKESTTSVKLRAHVHAIILFKYIGMGLVFFHPTVGSSCFQVFDCSPIHFEDPHHAVWFLQADHRIQCFDQKWRVHACISVLVILTYVLGFPMACWYVMRELHKFRMVIVERPCRKSPTEGYEETMQNDEDHTILSSDTSLWKRVSLRTTHVFKRFIKTKFDINELLFSGPVNKMAQADKLRQRLSMANEGDITYVRQEDMIQISDSAHTYLARTSIGTVRQNQDLEEMAVVKAVVRREKGGESTLSFLDSPEVQLYVGDYIHCFRPGLHNFFVLELLFRLMQTSVVYVVSLFASRFKLLYAISIALCILTTSVRAQPFMKRVHNFAHITVDFNCVVVLIYLQEGDHLEEGSTAVAIVGWFMLFQQCFPIAALIVSGVNSLPSDAKPPAALVHLLDSWTALKTWARRFSGMQIKDSEFLFAYLGRVKTNDQDPVQMQMVQRSTEDEVGGVIPHDFTSPSSKWYTNPLVQSAMDPS